MAGSEDIATPGGAMQPPNGGGNTLDVAHNVYGEQVTFGPFCLSPSERLLSRDGKPVDIGGRSFDLLVVLVERPGQVLSKRELLKRVWPDVVVEDGSLRFHMAGLRKLLGDGQGEARYIATQVGVGYAFVAPVGRSEASPRASRPTRPDPEAGGPILQLGTSTMPMRLPRLIGRDKDVRLLSERIVATSLFTITGPAGVGKTALAVELVHQLGKGFENNLSFVDFSMLEDSALVAQMIAGAMGIAVQGDDPLAVILGHVRNHRHLLLLDNCEHLIGVISGVVERLIAEAPGVRIFATSREPLRIRGEHVHRLEVLGYPDEPANLTLDELLSYPAVQLFYERAAAGDSFLDVDQQSARLIGEMCHRLDGMAFPIELAAVRVATHGIATTAHLLKERFSLSWPGHRTAAPRQQTLHSMLDWSYDLLREAEKIVLERLAVFVGPFSIDAALEVVADGSLSADEVAAALDDLTSKSLTVPDRSRGTGTYRLLEMTRAYGREKLLSRGAQHHGAVARRHAAFFLSELDAAAQDEDALHDTKAVRQQLGNIRSALDWTFGENGDLTLGVRLAAASASVFLNLSSLVECRTWSARALAGLKDDQRGSEMELELQAALGISLMFTRGSSDTAGTALTRALDVATNLEDRRNELRILGRLHIFHERIGEYSTALAYAERAVAVAEGIGDPEALGVAYSLSGISHHLSGDQMRARRELELSLKKSPPSDRRRTIHYGFDHRNRSGIALARALWLIGQTDRARQVAAQTLREAERLDHPVTHCIAIVWSVVIDLWIGDLDKAEQTLDVFDNCAEVNAFDPYIAAGKGFRGVLALQRDPSSYALSAVEECLSRLRAARYELLTTPFSIFLAAGLIQAQRFTEACDLVDAAIMRCRVTGEHLATPELLRLKAQTVQKIDPTWSSAVSLLEEAMAICKRQGSRAWELRSATDLAALLVMNGQHADARSVLGGVRSYFPNDDQTPDVRRADALLASLSI